jgi:protein-disulfide isomerase
VERDDVVRQLEQVRQRRHAAAQLEAELAREQAELEAKLGHRLEGDTPDEEIARSRWTSARLEGVYGALRTPDDLPAVLHTWRQTIPGTGSLLLDVQSDRDHVRGDPAAPVVVVEYGDYQCPECAEANALYARAKPWFEDGRLLAAFRHFPLVDAHPLAFRAAQAVEAAAAQGRFWQMHELLMAYEIVTDDDDSEHIRIKSRRDAIGLEHAARRAGLDVARFRAEIDDPAATERILEDFRSGLASGVNGTPTFYVNGRRTDVIGPDELYDRVAEVVAAIR